MRRLIVTALVAVLAAPALAEDVQLVTGEVLKGKVSERSSAGLRIDHPVLGRLWISGENVVSVDGGPLVDPVTQAVTDLQDAAAATEAAAPEPEVDPAEAWKFSIALGASGKSGNGDSNDLNASVGAEQEDATKRWRLLGEYVYADSDNEKTKDKAGVTVLRDFKLKDSPWFFYAAGKMEWDEFTPWDRRASLSAGAGREIYKDESWEVRGRAGFGYTKEWGSETNEWRPEGLIGAEAKWTINDWQSIEGNTYYFPDFDDGGEYRITSRLDWSIRLNDLGNLHLKLGIKNEYDSHRTKPFDRDEFEYYVALAYSF